MKLRRTLRLRGEANQCASGRSLHSHPKPITFQFFASLLRPLHAFERRKSFWFWFGVSSPKNSVSTSIYLRAFHSAFFASTPTRGVPLSEFIVVLYYVNQHNPLRIARSHSLARLPRRLCESLGGFTVVCTPHLKLIIISSSEDHNMQMV